MAVMQDASDGRAYAVNAPVSDNRAGLTSPRGWRACRQLGLAQGWPVSKLAQMAQRYFLTDGRFALCLQVYDLVDLFSPERARYGCLQCAGRAVHSVQVS